MIYYSSETVQHHIQAQLYFQIGILSEIVDILMYAHTSLPVPAWSGTLDAAAVEELYNSLTTDSSSRTLASDSCCDAAASVAMATSCLAVESEGAGADVSRRAGTRLPSLSSWNRDRGESLLHCTTLHCTTLHCTTLHYTTLHYTDYTTLHYTTLH